MVASRSSLSRQLQDYRLTTAEILYHMPDHPGLLQTYVWQELDLAPRFPVLRRFLDFWSSNLDGRLHSVRVAHLDLVCPGRMRHVDALMSLQ
ncbi:usg protein [Niveispirillum fermenti]|uniref:usg protein n=1 Tax=Niveispirillum fermenti TaxID=1233113 RepID=UPI003A8B0FEF